MMQSEKSVVSVSFKSLGCRAETTERASCERDVEAESSRVSRRAESVTSESDH